MSFKKIRLSNLKSEQQLRFCESDEECTSKNSQNYRREFPRCLEEKQIDFKSNVKMLEMLEPYNEKKSWKPKGDAKDLAKIEKSLSSSKGLIKMNSLEEIYSEQNKKERCLKSTFKTAFSKVK